MQTAWTTHIVSNHLGIAPASGKKPHDQLPSPKSGVAAQYGLSRPDHLVVLEKVMSTIDVVVIRRRGMGQ